MALNHGIINSNPCQGSEVPTRSTSNIEEVRKCWMNKDEYNKFRDWVLNEYKAEMLIYNTKLIEICDILTYTGMRREELAGLRWNVFDENKRQLTIQATRVSINGVDTYSESLKNKHSYRVYTLTDRIINIFINIRNRQQSLGLYRDDGYIFIYETNKGGLIGKPISLDNISRMFKKAVRKCPYITDKSLHLHHLRHTCCSIMFSLHYSEDEVRAWLGHSDSSRVTKRVYNHYKHIFKLERLIEFDNCFKNNQNRA